MIDFNNVPAAVTPKQIATRMALGIRRALNMSEAQVYVAAHGGEVVGMDRYTVQVVPGGQQTYGSGDGGQEGGAALLRQTQVTLYYWLTLNTDLSQMSQDALVRESEGILDFMEKLRQLFANTDLGGILLETMKWRGTSEAVVQDVESGVFYCTQVHTAPFASPLPTDFTLTAEDLADE